MLDEYKTNEYSFTDLVYINDHLQFIDYVDRTYDYDIAIVEPAEAYRYQGNLFGLFNEMKISPNLYMYTMYINGLVSPTDFDGVKCNFKIVVSPPIPED